MNQPIPTLQPFNGDNIPASLQEQKRWAPWRAIWNVKRGKFDKIPAHAKAPYYGISTARPERWSSYADALKAFLDNPAVFAGVGYVMTGPHDVVGIDLDNCVKDNTIAPWALEVVNQVGGYTEISPSGNGLRILAAGAIDHDWTNHEVGIEVYGGNEPRFLTVTGQRLKLSVLDVTRPDPAVLAQLATQYAKARTTAAVISLQLPDLVDEMLLPGLDSMALPASVAKFLTTGDHGGDRSRALFAASVALYSAGLDDDEVFSILVQNPYAFEVALDHRRQDHDRAEMYIWVEHCQKGKAKSSPVATLSDFESLAQIPAPAVLLEAPGEPVHILGDVDDFDVLDDIVAAAPPVAAAKPKMRFEVQPAASFAGGAAPTWLVKNVIPMAELIVLFGESGSGKSFIALDIAMAIVRGIDWRGNRTKPGRVVYIAAEGAGGFRNRLNAYARAHDFDLAELGDRFGVIHAAPNLMVKDDALDVCKAIVAGGPVALAMVDTFAQTMPGANENSGEDVGKALQHCKGIHRATGAPVLLVHHAGKDASKGARGWSGLRAAADAELEVARTPTGRVMRSTKQKDGEDGLAWGFDLQVVPIGVDEDGDAITSCVVVETAVPVPAKGGAGANKNGGVWSVRCLEVLGEMMLAQSAGIEKKAVIEEVLRRSPEGSDNRHSAGRALNKILKEDDGEYGIEDGCIFRYE